MRSFPRWGSSGGPQNARQKLAVAFSAAPITRAPEPIANTAVPMPPMMNPVVRAAGLAGVTLTVTSLRLPASSTKGLDDGSEYTPDGKFVGVYGSGIRNPAGIGVNPTTGEVWCSTNERDSLGDNLVPDYITHVQPGGFYGWPWYYIGGHPDPRLEGKHPELKDKVIIPDVLLQPHNASLELTFYDGAQFPREYRGDLFAAEHGSWNRANRTGYEVIRVPLEDGHASGVFEDFITGFVTPGGEAWGRPVGVTVAQDGSLYFTDDGTKSIWRVSYVGK